MNITDLKEKWQELFIRFNTSPKLYQKIDFLQLLKFLKGLLERGTGLVEDDLKTINGESIVGEGDMEIKEQFLNAGNALKIEDIENSDEKLISVTSHIYDEKNNNCLFGKDNVINSTDSVAFGKENEISSEGNIEQEIEFLGYAKTGIYEYDIDALEFFEGSNQDTKFQYNLMIEIQELSSAEYIQDIPDIVGSYLFSDDDAQIYLGKIINAARYTGDGADHYNTRIYFSLDTNVNPEIFGDGAVSVWRSPCVSTNSLVHGYSNFAKNINTHAEGKDTEALGKQSHSEGEFTTAHGDNSHAEGQYTTAFGHSSHAEGEGGNISLFRVGSDAVDAKEFDIQINQHTSDSAISFFYGSDFLSDSDFNAYSQEKSNKLAGWIGRPLYKASGELLAIVTGIDGNVINVDRPITVYENDPIYIKTGSTGANAHSEGYLSDASGTNAHAEGERTLATGTNAHSEGYYTKAFGGNSHAEGEHTEALAFGAHAEGHQTHTEGEYSHTEGFDTKASGTYAHGEGIHSSAQGEGSHAEGYNCSTEGNTVFKPTEYTVTVYDYDEDSQELTLSINEGSSIYDFGRLFNTFKTIQFENLSNEKFYLINYKVSRFDDGDLIILVKDESARSGTSQIKNSEYISIDDDYKVNKEITSVAAHAEGKDTQASQTASHSEGINTRADGDAAHAEGVDSKSLSRGAHAEGINTFVNEHSEGSHTEGYETQTDADYSHAEGWKTVAQNHNGEGYGSHAEGGETLTEGTFSHAEGEHTRALNRGSHAEGYKTDATNEYEHAEGKWNVSNNTHINTSVEYVDLGLPSGNLWATCNIGATSPGEYGDYFAWGEVEPKDSYEWPTYKWCNGTNNTLTKYCTDSDYWGGSTPDPDGLTRLVLDDDVAAKTLGENWRIPSVKDFEELLENTNHYWTDEWDGGYVFESKLNSSIYIFLPAAGYNWEGIVDVGVQLKYGTSTTDDPDKVRVLEAYSHGIYTDEVINKCCGCSIRPVSPRLKTIHSVGVGESDGDHRNALEITTDGSIFIKGVGDYDGSNPQSGKSLQQILLQLISQGPGLPESAGIVIAAALNDLNDRIDAISQS